MSARVVAITKPLVEEAETAGEFVVYAARVSNPGNQANKETGPKLLAYLQHNKHWSPLEMASATVEIITTRDIARQLLRHRSLSFQEFSQRYASVEDAPVFREARMQHATNRQMSVETDDLAANEAWSEFQRKVWKACSFAYETALAAGIAKEVARAVLPEGMTPSTLYVAGTLRSWLHYLAVREDPTTQKEHRMLAQEIRAALAEHEPAIFGEAA